MGAFALHTDSVATTSGSRAAPTATDGTEGMSLKSVKGFRVIVSAASGQTLSGGGNMLAWCFVEPLGRWCRNPQLDFAVSATSVRDMCSPDFEVGVGEALVVFQASSVTASGGEITTQIQAW